MFKKIFALLLALMMLFAFTACGKNGGDNTEPAGPQSQQEVIQDQDPGEGAPEEEITEEETGDPEEEYYEEEYLDDEDDFPVSDLRFRSKKLLTQHYDKHGRAMGFASLDDYVYGANWVISNPKTLHKTEAEDGDDVYYLEQSNEFVVVSKDGYIRTYFNPSGGIDYYNRQ